MKSTKIGLVIGLALWLATSAFAASKGTLQIHEPVTVAGTQLRAGDYKVAWDGTGSNVEVNIMKGKDVVAKTPARLVELDRTPADDAAVVSSNSDGSHSLSQIRFHGKKYALAIGNETAQVQGGTAENK
jgi:hypothetical protein